MCIRKCAIAELGKEVGPGTDVFICCSSFEERCLSVASQIGPQRVGKAIICENEDLHVYVAHNVHRLKEIFGDRCLHTKISSTYPITTADAIKKQLLTVSSQTPLRYLVDVTTFTHEGLLILLKLLHLSVKKSDRVQFLYTSASDYGGTRSGQTENMDRWLSKGVAEVRSVLGYPGEFFPSRKTHLIVLVGFEHERASKLVEIYEPNILSLGYGKAGSETSQKHYSANRNYHKLVREAVATYTTVREFEFSCSNPWDAKKAILAQVATTPDHNVVVAPMNTKISTVGCALAAVENQTIQLSYAKAMSYNYQQYSVGGTMCYLFEVPELFSR